MVLDELHCENWLTLWETTEKPGFLSAWNSLTASQRCEIRDGVRDLWHRDFTKRAHYGKFLIITLPEGS